MNEGEGTGTANILPENSTYRCVRQILHLQTLDQLRAAHNLPLRCSVVKIDTDGYDLKILQGANQLLEVDRPVIFGEFSAHCMDWHQQKVQDVVKLAEVKDYLVWQKLVTSWTFSPLLRAETYVQDLLLVPAEKRHDFAWCLAGNN